jgi:CRP-like cAMP-binding protein
MEYSEFLRRHISQVVALTESEFDLVSQAFKPLHVSKKTLLLNCDEIVTKEYLVMKGCMKSFTYDETGKEYIVQFAMENWWISDYPAYARQAPATICIQALEDCIVLELDVRAKQELCEAVPKMSVFFGTKAFSGYVALQKRVLSLLKNSASEKYELLLSQYPELFQRVSKTTLSHYLGVSRETLSRLHKKK